MSRVLRSFTVVSRGPVQVQIIINSGEIGVNYRHEVGNGSRTLTKVSASTALWSLVSGQSGDPGCL